MRRYASNATFLGSFPTDVPDTHLPEIAFAGRSNVGKSSALNALLGSRAMARVSSRPGRTQAINLFKIGDVAVFVDLPGYGYAAVPDEVMASWKPMVEGYLSHRENLCLVVVLVDARREPQQADGMLIDGLRDAGLMVVVVATKVDKLPKHARKPALHLLREAFDLEDDEPLPLASPKREGVDAIWDRLESAVRDQS